MSVQSARAFVHRLAVDAELLARFEAAATDEAKQEIVKQAGFAFSKADADEVKKQWDQALSDEQLDAVAGGVEASELLFGTPQLKSLGIADQRRIVSAVGSMGAGF